MDDDALTRVDEAVVVALAVVNHKLNKLQVGCKSEEGFLGGTYNTICISGEFQGKDGLVGNVVGDLD